jgi:O-antigen/teichoic acid export membrane protein
VQSAFGPAEDVLNMLGAERVAARVSFAALALAVTLNFALIPSCGIIGAAVAMALAAAARGGAVGRGAATPRPLDPHPGVTRP